MVTAELGACEWFVWDLRRSNLIDRGQLEAIIGEFLQQNPGAEPPQLAQYLVEQGILTDFQAERLLQGKTQGFVLGPFTLTDALGSGSMGTVYKAQSKTDNNLYAVKVLPRRSMWNVRLARRKVRAFESVKHPAVVPFVDVGTAGGMHYLAWPLVEGEPLDRLVQKQGKLQPEFAAYLAFQLAQGLDASHKEGLFHGLIKPSNAMVGASQEIYILDFGIGCLLAETEGESLVDTMSTANSVASGLDCASPESIMDPTNLTPSGDQYSLGCVLYYMLTGQFPFPEGNVAEKMMAHQFQKPTPIAELNPAVTPGLAEVVDRLMQKKPEERYLTTGDAAAALQPFIGKFGSVPSRIDLPLPRAVALGNAARLNAPPSAPVDATPVPVTRPLGPSKNVPVAPNQATPRPQTMGALPNRDAIQGGGARQAPVRRPATMASVPAAHAAPVPAPVAKAPEPVQAPTPAGPRVIPGLYNEARDEEGSLTSTAVAATVMVALVLVFFTAMYFKWI